LDRWTCLDDMQKRKMSLLFPESNHGLTVHSHSLFRISYPGSWMVVLWNQFHSGCVTRFQGTIYKMH
jgi:hypothetical protein